MQFADNEAKSRKAYQEVNKLSETTIDFLNRQSELGAFFSNDNKPLSERQMLSQIAADFYMLNNFNKMLASHGLLDQKTSRSTALDNAKTVVDSFVIKYGNSEKFGTAESIRSNPSIQTWTGSVDGALRLSKNTIARVVAPALQKHLVSQGLLPETFLPIEGQALPTKKYALERKTETQRTNTRNEKAFAQSPEIKALRISFIDGYRKLFEQNGLKFDEKQSNRYYGLYDQQINPIATQRPVVRKQIDEQLKINKQKIKDAQDAYVAEKKAKAPVVRTMASKPVFGSEEAPSISMRDMSADDFRLMNRGETSTESYTPARNVLESTNNPGGLLYWGTHAASLAWAINAGMRMNALGNPDAIANAIAIWLPATYALHGIKNIGFSGAALLKRGQFVRLFEVPKTPYSQKLQASLNRFIQKKNEKNLLAATGDALLKMVDSKYGLIPFVDRVNLVAISRRSASAIHQVKQAAKRLESHAKKIQNVKLRNLLEDDMADFLNPSRKLDAQLNNLASLKSELDKQIKVQEELATQGLTFRDERYDAYLSAQKAFDSALSDFQNTKKNIRAQATERLERQLSKPLMKDIMNIRASAAEIQNLWLSSGALTPEVAAKIQFALDDHIRRVYLAFYDREAWLNSPDFAKNRAALINMIADANYTKEGGGASAEGSKSDFIKEATIYVDRIIEDKQWFVANAAGEISESLLSGGVRGLNKKNFAQRVKLNKATQDFLGLIENPLVGVVDGQSLDRNALVNLQTSQALESFALKANLAVPIDSIGKGMPPSGFVQIPLVNPERNPFIARNYWHPSMVPVIQDMLMPASEGLGGQVFNLIKKLVGMRKASMTLSNIALWATQIPSNMMLQAIHGDLVNTKIIDNLSTLAHGGYVKASDLFNVLPLKNLMTQRVVPGEDLDLFMKLASQYGHLSAGNVAFDIREIFTDSDSPHKLDWWMTKLGDVFSIADTSMRFSAFAARYMQVRTEAIKRAESGGPISSMEDIAWEATTEVYRDYPDMGMLPESLKTASQIGFVPAFFSFNYNIIRGLTNAMVTNTKTAVGSDPIKRPRALLKLSNMLMALTILGTGALEYLFSKDEKSLDSDQKEAAITLDPSNASIVDGVNFEWIDKEAGTIKYFDVKQIQPTASVFNVLAYVNRYANATTEADKNASLKGIATHMRDYVSLSPDDAMSLVTMVELLAPGKTIKNGELIDISANTLGLKGIEKVMAVLGRQVTPVDVNQFLKLQKADKGVINPSTGNPYTKEEVLSRYTTMPERTLSIDGTIRRIAGNTHFNILERNKLSSKEFTNAPITQNAILEIRKASDSFKPDGLELKRLMDKAETLGRRRIAIVTAMRSSGLPDNVIASVVSSDYKNINPAAKIIHETINNNFDTIYKNRIVSGQSQKQINTRGENGNQVSLSTNEYQQLIDAFNKNWRGFLVYDVFDKSINSQKFDMFTESVQADGVNLSQIDRKIIDEYASKNQAAVSVLSYTKKSFLDALENLLTNADKFNAYGDYLKTYPKQKDLFDKFVMAYAERINKKETEQSKVQVVFQ
jgi:hypothetical protein